MKENMSKHRLVFIGTYTEEIVSKTGQTYKGMGRGSPCPVRSADGVERVLQQRGERGRTVEAVATRVSSQEGVPHLRAHDRGSPF